MEMSETTRSEINLSNRWLSAALIIISALIILPFFATPFLPLNDYPFHLARIIILSSLENTSFSEFYTSGSLLLPNMAMDLVALPLAEIIGPELASRCFAALALLSMLFGTLTLHYSVHGKLSAWPLLAVAFLFNGIFRFGFLNYLFGLGIAFAAAGVLFRMKPGALKLATCFCLSTLLVLLHFEAFAVFAIISGSLELFTTSTSLRGNWKKSLGHLLLAALPFLITITLFLLTSPTADDVHSKQFAFSFNAAWKILGGLYSLATLITWLDLLILAVLAGIFITACFKSCLSISYPLLLAIIMLITAYLIVPGSLMGSHFVDVRLGPAIALLVIACLDIKSPELWQQKVTIYITLLLTACISLTHWITWQTYGAQISRIVSSFEKTERDSVIFAATAEPFTRLIADDNDRMAAWRPPLKHVASYAALRGSRFVPMTFADPNKQPMNIQKQYLHLKAFQGDNPRKTFTAESLLEFIQQIQHNRSGGAWPQLSNAYVFVVGFDRLADQLDTGKFDQQVNIVHRKDNFALLKLY